MTYDDRCEERPIFTEFRKDGWPLCPRCEEDELWSSIAISAQRAVTLEECWAGDFTCYYCNWKSNGRRHSEQCANPELLVSVKETVL